MLIAFFTLIEILVFIGVLWAYFNERGYGACESFSVSVVFFLLSASLVFQSVFLLSRPGLSFFVEAALGLWALYDLAVRRRVVFRLLGAVGGFFRTHPVAVSALALIWMYLFLSAFLLPEGNHDSMRYNLARVLLFQQDRTLFLDRVTEYHQAVFPVGGDLLSHFFLRYYTDYGVGVFSFLSYVSIVLGVYALSRRFAARRFCFLSALVVAGMPLPVYQATGSKPDIVAAAAGVFCLLMGCRLYERLTGRELFLLLLGLGFGVSVKTTFWGFAVSFALVFGWGLYARHGWSELKVFFLRSRRWLLLSVMPVLIFSQIWLFAYNYRQWGGILGPESFVSFHRNRDGISGAAANLSRYLLQSVHLLTPVDLVARQVTGERISSRLQNFYDRFLLPVWKDRGAAWPNAVVPFSIADKRWGDSENGAWFGPLGFFLVLPALVYALLRGQRCLKLVVLSLIGYLAAVCFQVAWMPWNGRFLSLLFVGSAPAISFGFSQIGRKLPDKLMVAAAMGIMAYAAVFNQQKPLFYWMSWRVDQMVTSALECNIWTQTAWGKDRQYWNRRFFGDDRIDRFSALVRPKARVAVFPGGVMWLFPYMIVRPDVDFLPFLASSPLNMASCRKMDQQPDYLLCEGAGCGNVLQLNGNGGSLYEVWDSGADSAGRKGSLYQLQKSDNKILE